jgi:putative DNA methylase
MKKKLIEVALPLEAINKESAREKSIRHGHPSTLHLWWARRPLAACRAVLFASLVDDPSSLPEQFPTEADQDKERQRLFRLIEKLVLWENSNNRAVLDEAHAEILKSTGGNPPPIYDPFCGGGSIPLEAQRLGLEAHGSDLNPVAVLITKAHIEIPPKFAGRPPVNPGAKAKMSGTGMWTGARGLADDVRYYGQWMRDRAFERIGHLYPKVQLPNGDGAAVIAWLWARTVSCPNPACGARMPLIRSFALSTKIGKKAWVSPAVDHAARTVKFEVKIGDGAPPEGTKQVRRSRCLFCNETITDVRLRAQAKDHGVGALAFAVVIENSRGRTYISPEPTAAFNISQPTAPWLDQPLPTNARWFSPPGYGLITYRDLFTPRQLVALTTFSELVNEAREQALRNGATEEYAFAIATYLTFAVDKMCDTNTTLCTWQVDPPDLERRSEDKRCPCRGTLLRPMCSQTRPVIFNGVSALSRRYWTHFQRETKVWPPRSMQRQSLKLVVRSCFQQTLLITTTLAALTCRTSSMFGCAET